MIATLTFVTALVLAQPSAGQEPATAEQAVRQADAARVKAFVSADIPALRRLLGDDLTYTHSTGRLDTKAQVIDALQSGRTKYESYEPSDVQVRVYGTAAVLTGRAAMRVTADGQTTNLQLRFTSVYVQRDGRWQFVAWESTRLPAQP